MTLKKDTTSIASTRESFDGLSTVCSPMFHEHQWSRAARDTLIRRRRSKAWVYPLVTFMVAFLVMAFLAPVILNPFRDLYDDFGMTLPSPTLWVIYVAENILGKSIRSIAYGLLAAAVGIGFLLLVNRYSLMSRYCSICVSGNSDSVSAMASFTGMLAHLLGSGMPLPDAIEKSGQESGHRYLSEVCHQLAMHVRDSDKPIFSSSVASRFPRNVLEALQSKTGSLPNLELLRELSVSYDERVSARAEWSRSVIGVFGMLLVGGVVLFVVLALFMPFTTLLMGLS